MAIVISKNKMEKYNVNPYHFKVLSHPDNDLAEPEVTQETTVVEQTKSSKPKISEVDSSAISQSSKDALIESLMKNNDEMSSNFIKLQMRLEAKEEEFKAELKRVKEKAFNDGIVEGQKQAQASYEADIKTKLSQFVTSVSTLETKAKEFETSLEAIKSSLIGAAIDIASEVVNVELKENSSEVAKVLSSELIKELQSASKITLKVNPIDYNDISVSVGKLDNVEVVPDTAVSSGGVIAVSENGNIDAQISKRFEKVKKAALSE
jgi:flagellar assembly protein FliH